jgi:hypothetical protein
MTARSTGLIANRNANPNSEPHTARNTTLLVFVCWLF